MEHLKVAFLDFWPEINQENIFLPILQRYFDVEVTTVNPDVILHSIFGGMRETPKYKCKKILFLGENYRSQNYPTDYSISFDAHSETNYRLPLWQFYLILRPELQSILFGPRFKQEEFDKFAFFIVSNAANFIRNGAFQTLNSYKKVSSYGRYLTNDFSLQKESKYEYWRDAKYNFLVKNKHKFGIAFENNSYPGYCTEKLMDVFLAGSMPIYWGDPKIKEDWNVNAFINVNSYANWMDEVKKIDMRRDYFNKYYDQPIFTEEQRDRHINNIKEFESWFINIIKR